MKAHLRYWLTTILASMVIGSVSGQAKQTQKDKHLVRIGELLITATSIEDGPANRQFGLPHRLFTVHIRVQNVGRGFPCTSLTSYLTVEPFYQYSPNNNFYPGQPSIHELLPGEVAEGQYSFDIRDGVVPKELVLKAIDSRETRCQQRIDWGAVWHYRTEAEIPIEGLPVESKSQRQLSSSQREPLAPLSVAKEQIPTAEFDHQHETLQQVADSLLMDDGFEYRVIDYGIGQVQIRSDLGEYDSLSPPVFWMELGITNRSEHLLGTPRYSPSAAAALGVRDNWGNEYKAWCPLVMPMWRQNSLPVPARKVDSYKPQESNQDLAVIPLRDFVEGISELRVYLNRYSGDRVAHFFSLRSPMLRNRNFLCDQLKPSATELNVTAGEEALRLHR